MTAPNGPLLFNSSTGSDTAASGLGPASALSGAGASTTAASAVVTGITTTGVTAGDMLWVDSTSGRRFSIIASVDSGTQVTCDDVFDNTEASRAWGIGGKRRSLAGSCQSLDSAGLDFDGLEVIQFEDGYTETFTSRLRFRGPTSYASPLTIRTDPAASVVARFSSSHTADPFVLGGSAITWERAEFEQTNSSGTLCTNGSGSCKFVSCVFGAGATKPIEAWECNTSDNSVFIDCEFHATSTNCVITYGATSFIECLFSGGTNGLQLFSTAVRGNLVKGCIFTGQVDGILSQVGGGELWYWKHVVGNIFNCTNSALRFINGDSLRQVTITFMDNIIANSTYGVAYDTGTTSYSPTIGVFRNNAFCNIGTSNYLNSYGGQTGDVTVANDPFVDSANGDYNLNSTTGGGAVLRATNHTIRS